jgi:hypothetical protein
MTHFCVIRIWWESVKIDKKEEEEAQPQRSTSSRSGSAARQRHRRGATYSELRKSAAHGPVACRDRCATGADACGRISI